MALMYAACARLPDESRRMRDQQHIAQIEKINVNTAQYTLEDYIDALVQTESNGDPKAVREEPQINDRSIGLGQLLTSTARELEEDYVKLPRLGDNIEERLMDPEVNITYTITHFESLMHRYNDDPLLAIAAYNAGGKTPYIAACQETLNRLGYGELAVDGVSGEKTRAAVSAFQREHDLKVDGIVGPQTSQALEQAFETKFPEEEMPLGKIPQNGQTPYHVVKFIEALRDERRVLPESLN